MKNDIYDKPLYLFEGSGAPECKIKRSGTDQLSPEIQAIYDELGVGAFLRKGYLNSDWPICDTPLNETVDPEKLLNEIASSPGLKATAIMRLPMSPSSNWRLTPGTNEREDLQVLTKYLEGFGRDLEIRKINNYWVLTFEDRLI